MGYNIEVAFNFLKDCSITQQTEKIKMIAEDCMCNYWQENFEFENNVQYRRSHCVITIYFDHLVIQNLVKFIKNIKKNRGIYIELVFDENNNKILYASKYYITQKMNKGCAKDYNENKRKRSYSEDATMILDSIHK